MTDRESVSAQDKLEKLRGLLTGYGSLAVAYSGGLDSSFLLKVASDVLGEKAVGVTARSSTYPEREYNESIEFAKEIGVRQVVIESEELAIEGFTSNPPRRCYFCKKELFTKLQQVARKEGIKYIADGSNADDVHDFRPGMEAAAELGVVSPLKEADLTKDDIRILSKQMELSTWDKPSFACLSSRFPYGHEITPDKLKMVGAAEDFLRELGFRQMRVRHHGDIARIEVPQEEIATISAPAMRQKVTAKLRQIGYNYVTIDLEGYRTGSMNIPLGKIAK
jgi:pyridinium-3,5-biscarboxylic acid mononucleotide sulfurtransferase